MDTLLQPVPVIGRQSLSQSYLTFKDGGNAEDCRAAPVRPELTALVFPYTSEQSLPESAAVRLAAHEVEHTALGSRSGCAGLNPPSATPEET